MSHYSEFMLSKLVLEKTLETSLDCKEIKPVNGKENQPWRFIGQTYAEAEALILWLPDAKSWLFRKDADAGKDWEQEEKGMTEDEMVGWHHQFNGPKREEIWEILKNKEVWRIAVHGVTKSWTWLRDWTTTVLSYTLFSFHTEKSVQ